MKKKYIKSFLGNKKILQRKYKRQKVVWECQFYPRPTRQLAGVARTAALGGGASSIRHNWSRKRSGEKFWEGRCNVH